MRLEARSRPGKPESEAAVRRATFGINSAAAEQCMRTRGHRAAARPRSTTRGHGTPARSPVTAALGGGCGLRGLLLAYVGGDPAALV